MFITVIICTRNRAKSLRRTLDSLFLPGNLEAVDWEVLVVESSTDDTAEMCRDFASRYPSHFRFLKEKKLGKSHALNTAISAARGEILAFTDDDVICAPDYLQGIRTVFTEYAADAAQGRVLLDCEGGQPAWLDSRLSPMAGYRDSGDEVIELKGTMFGHNMNVRARVFKTIGGFSPELGPGGVGMWEDTEISLRMRAAGFRLIYAPQILIRHQLPQNRLTKSFLRRRFFQQGRAVAYYQQLPVSLPRFGLYVLKECVRRETQAIWYLCTGRPAQALWDQCFALGQAGLFWQHICFMRGVPSRLSGSPLPSRKAAVSHPQS